MVFLGAALLGAAFWVVVAVSASRASVSEMHLPCQKATFFSSISMADAAPR